MGWLLGDHGNGDDGTPRIMPSMLDEMRSAVVSGAMSILLRPKRRKAAVTSTHPKVSAAKIVTVTELLDFASLIKSYC